MTSNPASLLSDIRIAGRKSAVKGEDITVNQNVLWATQMRGRTQEWNLKLCLPNELIDLGGFRLPERPDQTSKRLPYVAFALGGLHGAVMIYVNGASDAEKAALLLTALLDHLSPELRTRELRDLEELVEKAIHPSYALIRTLRCGVAFHYGNMPLIVRERIESLFAQGHIKFLICTSTLLEGVNTPCRSIFVRAPKRGNKNDMTPEDFWNLAGRAGRWGKEFQGSIVCVDAEQENVWKCPPPRVRGRSEIVRASDRYLNDVDGLITYLETGSVADKHKSDLDYTVSLLASSFFQNGSILSASWAHRFKEAEIRRLEETLASILAKLNIPQDVIVNNPGISPLAMENLLHDFSRYQGALDELIPEPPESSSAVETYSRVFERISNTFGWEKGNDKRRLQLALTVVDWMCGRPLRMLIDNRLRYFKVHQRSNKTPQVIRDTMYDVENIARFEAPKYLNCYQDLLRHFLQNNNRADLIEGFSDITLMLEFGASTQTQMSLMSIGLSRTSALLLAELIVNTKLEIVGCLSVLADKEAPWRKAGLPALVCEEVESALCRLIKGYRRDAMPS